MSNVWTLLLFGGILTRLSLGQYSMHFPDDQNNNNVLRTYRRCMWEQSKFLPRRLVLLSLCSNLFCENNQLSARSSCLDMLPDQCIQGDEEELMYKPFPDCCPVYCNLKRRMNRLKSMHFRHRLVNKPPPQPQQHAIILNDYNQFGLMDG